MHSCAHVLCGGGHSERAPNGSYSELLFQRVRDIPALSWITMATPPEGRTGSTPVLDEWIATAGEAAVAAEVEETKLRIDEGSLPSFDNPADLLAFVMRGHRQSA